MTRALVLALCVACGGVIGTDEAGAADAGTSADTGTAAACTPYLRPATPQQTVPAACNGHCDDIITTQQTNGPGYDLCTNKCTSQADCAQGFICATVTSFDTIDHVCYPACLSATCPTPLACDSDHACR